MIPKGKVPIIEGIVESNNALPLHNMAPTRLHPEPPFPSNPNIPHPHKLPKLPKSTHPPLLTIPPPRSHQSNHQSITAKPPPSIQTRTSTNARSYTPRSPPPTPPPAPRKSSTYPPARRSSAPSNEPGNCLPKSISALVWAPGSSSPPKRTARGTIK